MTSWVYRDKKADRKTSFSFFISSTKGINAGQGVGGGKATKFLWVLQFRSRELSKRTSISERRKVSLESSEIRVEHAKDKNERERGTH